MTIIAIEDKKLWRKNMKTRSHGLSEKETELVQLLMADSQST